MADLITIFVLGPMYFLYFFFGAGIYSVPFNEVLASIFGTAVWFLFFAAVGSLFTG